MQSGTEKEGKEGSGQGTKIVREERLVMGGGKENAKESEGRKDKRE